MPFVNTVKAHLQMSARQLARLRALVEEKKRKEEEARNFAQEEVDEEEEEEEEEEDNRHHVSFSVFRGESV